MRVALFTETFLPKIDGIVTVTCLLLDHLTKRGIETVDRRAEDGLRALQRDAGDRRAGRALPAVSRTARWPAHDQHLSAGEGLPPLISPISSTRY